MISRFRNPNRPASVLLAVLVVVAILTLSTAAYLELMQGQRQAARRHGRVAQAERLVESGGEYLKQLLALPLSDLQSQGGVASNPAVFQRIVVDEQPDDFSRGLFTVVSPGLSGGSYLGLRYGLEDESAKLNVNALLAPGAEQTATTRLLALPGMTPDVADAILDWLDPDDMPRQLGAESESYSALSPPCRPRNGPIAELDELLVVRGVTPELLYGVDQNRSLSVDGDEAPRGALADMQFTTGVMNRGWSAYLTTLSVEGPRKADGTLRIDLNSQNLQDLYTRLQKIVGDPEAKFIIAYRQNSGGGQSAGGSGAQNGLTGAGAAGNGGAAGNNGGGNGATSGTGGTAGTQSPGTTQGATPLATLGSTGGGQPAAQQPGGNQQPQTITADAIKLDLTRPGGNQLHSLLDLVDASVQLPAEGTGPPSTVQSPWKADAASYQKLLALMDSTTVSGLARISGRVNVNLAPRAVLNSIPNLPPAAVDQIIARREPAADMIAGAQRHALWLLSSGILTLDQMRQVEPYVTARGDVFSGQIIGFFDGGSPIARAQVVIDRSAVTPRLRSWRSLTSFGPGPSRTTLGAADAVSETTGAGATP